MLCNLKRLYGYSFFIATNCKKVQDMELKKAKEYYEGIYNIYPKWIEYRKSKNKPIPFPDTLLIEKNN